MSARVAERAHRISEQAFKLRLQDSHHFTVNCRDEFDKRDHETFQTICDSSGWDRVDYSKSQYGYEATFAMDTPVAKDANKIQSAKLFI